MCLLWCTCVEVFNLWTFENRACLTVTHWFVVIPTGCCYIEIQLSNVNRSNALPLKQKPLTVVSLLQRRRKQAKAERGDYCLTTLLQLFFWKCFAALDCHVILCLFFVSLQYHRGRMVRRQWVFGLVSQDPQQPQPIFYVVQRRDANTLVPIIR